MKASSIEITNLGRRSLELAIELGRDLSELKSLLKEECPQRLWEEYVNDEIKLNPRSASNFMRLHRHEETIRQSENFSDLGIVGALKSLAKKPTKEKLLPGDTPTQKHPELPLDFSGSSEPDDQSSSSDVTPCAQSDPLPVDEAMSDEAAGEEDHLNAEASGNPDSAMVVLSPPPAQPKPVQPSASRRATPLISTERAEAAVQDLLCHDDLDPLRREIFMEVVDSVNCHSETGAGPESAKKLIPVLEKLTELLRQITTQA